MVRRISLLAVGVAALAMLSFAMAQDQGGRREDRGGQDRGGRNFDPAQFRERMMNSMKERMGSTDDEWKVLAPKIEKVMAAQRETRSGFGGFGGPDRGGRGGDRGGAGASDQQLSKVAQTQRDLRTLLENKDASADEISKKLTAYREARDKARAELQAAQKALKDVVTQRQEAMLVMSGMLE